MSKAENVKSICHNCGYVKALGKDHILDSHSRCSECTVIGCIDYFMDYSP